MGFWGGWWEGGVAHKETFLTFEDVDDTQPSICWCWALFTFKITSQPLKIVLKHSAPGNL